VKRELSQKSRFIVLYAETSFNRILIIIGKFKEFRITSIMLILEKLN